MLLGFGTQAAATVAVFHILNHAIFKAALFMTAGIVDHEAHSRDLRRLGGLRRLMPVTFAIALLGALAMAGIPPLNGFLSKELMLQEAAQTVWLTPWAMGLLATAAALLSVAYSLRFLAHGFLGPVRSDYPRLPHDPGPGLWAAPAILAVLAVVIGLLPMTSAAWLVGTAAQAVTGEAVAVKITHWHGLQAAALWMSLAAVGGGLMVLGAWPRLRALWDAMPKPEARRMFDALVEPLAGIARGFTERLHDGDFGRAIAIAVVTIAGAGLWAFAGGNHSPGTRALLPVEPVAVVLWGVLLVVALATTVLHRDRVVALNLADLAAKLPSLPPGDSALIRTAAVMLILVFAIKAALVPLQFWLPGTYANAPGVVAALFAIMTKVGAYSTLRFGTLVFPPDLPATGDLLASLLLPAALVSLAVGAIGTLGATTLPRLAAFAGIASMGLAFTAIAAFTPQTTAAALYYILHSTLATAILFLVADLVTRRRAHGRLDSAAPIAQSGLLAALFLAAATAMAGLPPLSGFIGKLLILDAFRDQAPLVWTVILGASFLMILGFARAGSTLFWKPEGAAPPAIAEPFAVGAAFSLLAGLAALTLLAGPVTAWLADTATALHAPAEYINANRLGQDG